MAGIMSPTSTTRQNLSMPLVAQSMVCVQKVSTHVWREDVDKRQLLAALSEFVRNCTAWSSSSIGTQFSPRTSPSASR